MVTAQAREAAVLKSFEAEAFAFGAEQDVTEGVFNILEGERQPVHPFDQFTGSAMGIMEFAEQNLSCDRHHVERLTMACRDYLAHGPPLFLQVSPRYLVVNKLLPLCRKM